MLTKPCEYPSTQYFGCAFFSIKKAVGELLEFRYTNMLLALADDLDKLTGLHWTTFMRWGNRTNF